MPIYEYQCSKCLQTLEIIQPMNAKTKTTCGEHCVAEGEPGDGVIQKLFSAMAIHSQAPGRSGSGELPEPPPCGGCGKEGTSCPFAT
jgi:putative FmdB family regulatory protein